jgi:hypothetical protein
MLQRHYAGEEIPAALLTDQAAGRAWYAERAPFLHPLDDGSNWNTAYKVALDAQCKQLGLANDSLAFLDALAARLAQDKADALATALLARYVPDVAPAEFGTWLATNRANLYFTEAGGWVWRVKGTRAVSTTLRPSSAVDPDEPVVAKAEWTETTLTITLRVRKGWHVYSPKTKEGRPVQFAIAEGSAFELAGETEWNDAEASDGKLSGYVEIKSPIKRVYKGSAMAVELSYVVCDEKACRPLKTLVLKR